MKKLTTDVLVIGGGTAGFGAALAAARRGLNVHLIEATNKIGGVMAFCPGMPWGAAYPNDVVIGGIMEELASKLFNMTPPMAEKRPCTLENFGPEIQYDPDVALTTMVEMLEHSGVQLVLNAVAAEPHINGNSITAVDVYDRRGITKYIPKIVIDCSGDGDISAKAGVPYILGDASGNMMGVSLTFYMVNADWERVFAHNDPYFQDEAAIGIAQGRLHPDLAKLYLMRGFHKNTVFCNTVVVRNVDGTDPIQVSKATQEGRRRCLQLVDFLRSDIDGFQNAFMVNLGPTVGVRETRKLEGVYRISGDDLRNSTKFCDGIVSCDNPIDDVMRASSAMTHDAIVESGAYYTIPFRSLIPKNIENLMFCGRIISADPEAFASVRGMPQCMAMGQACGNAAKIAIEKNISVQNIPTDDLVKDLQKQGLRGLGGEPLK